MQAARRHLRPKGFMPCLEWDGAGVPDMDSSLSEEETLHRDNAIAVSIGTEQPGQ